jgi:hypothetical protein
MRDPTVCFRTSSLAVAAIETTVLIFWLATMSARAQTREDPNGLLQKIRKKVAVHLESLPNYTCHEAVERLQRRAGTGFEHVDKVELEVAFVGKRELYARPGAPRFEEEEIHKIVPTGTIGNGSFGLHVETLFSGNSIAFQSRGTSKKEGHNCFRYDFTVSQETSHFLVRNGTTQAIVGYKGSFWVDATTLDLVRVDLRVDQIPAHMGFSLIQQSMKYTTMRIRDSEFLLPRDSQLVVYDQSGNYSLNIIRLERCREFTGDSVITFASPPDATSTDRKTPE